MSDELLKLHGIAFKGKMIVIEKRKLHRQLKTSMEWIGIYVHKRSHDNKTLTLKTL